MNEARTTQFSRSTNSLGSDLNEAFTIEIESKTEEHATLSERDSSCISRSSKKRLVYCGDGVLEEDEDEEEEKERREAEEKQKAIELRKKQDLEAKNLSWLPWFGYVANRSAHKALEVCDMMGEKLAWGLGITQPKFLYEVEEYNRMKQDELRRHKEDFAEEIVVNGSNQMTSGSEFVNTVGSYEMSTIQQVDVTSTNITKGDESIPTTKLFTK